MAELNDGIGGKLITFFLPQFHTIPENDKWWGKGFTEWTNTKKMNPLFKGHYQPRVPMNGDYYNLLDDEVKIRQAELAKQYGIYGFCYYHYWFKDGKQLLEQPAKQMLKNKKIEIPFCFSWANENWTRNWDGGNQEIIAEQDYGDENDWEKHLQYLVPFFRDNRYITMDGKPVFLIYRPELIPTLNKMLDYWALRMREEGFPGICYMIQRGDWYFDPTYDASRFSYQIRFEPSFSQAVRVKKGFKMVKAVQGAVQVLRQMKIEAPVVWGIGKLKNKHRTKKGPHKLEIINYDEVWSAILDKEADEKTVLGGFVDWDNTARNKNGFIYYDAKPEKFQKYLTGLLEKCKKEKCPEFIFINAWNEWAEGAYLEPDERYGYSYLEGVRKALKKEGYF